MVRYLAGEWDGDRWAGFRVRYGVYGQRQAGRHMIRLKVPGGIVPVPWLPVIAEAARRHGDGTAHITTRQNFQLYFVPLDRTPDVLELLHRGGVPTREAGGNTLRNMTACPLAGICPRERVDAGRVAAALAHAWIRHPLGQHMPRKFKTAVSGCATDCAGAFVHDLGLVAIEGADGTPGFRVIGAGGLGAVPVSGVELLPFAAAHELPAVVEAVMHIHHRFSDRRNKNAARLKFVLRRLGAERLVAEFRAEFERARGLPQRPWPGLAWRRPDDGTAPALEGVVVQRDGRLAVVVEPPLGDLSADQLDGLAAIAGRFGLAEVRTTPRQSLVVPDVAPSDAAALLTAVRALGLAVRTAGSEPGMDLVSCPGTTTCPIGITNSHGFAEEILRVARVSGVRVRVSGCQNSCGQHHLADFGFHGMAKKVAGRVAPHYQIHLGGDERQPNGVAFPGPIVPARRAAEALRVLVAAWRDGRRPGESVRAWAERLGEDGLAGLTGPLAADPADERTFVDFGEDRPFAGPVQGKGDCAAPFAQDLFLADLARDGLDRFDRALTVGRWAEALNAAEEAVAYAGRRLLARRDIEAAADAPAVVAEKVRQTWGGDPTLADALGRLEAERQVALGVGDPAAYRAAVADWIGTVDETLAAPSAAAARVAAQ
jgi:sulfite reductase (NADPH) hemoprotein beta-component